MKHLKREIKYWIQDTVRYYRLHHWRLTEFADRFLASIGMGLLFGAFCGAVLQSIPLGFGIAVTTAAVAMLAIPNGDS
mgnify:CR=1 FL=1